MPSAKQRRQKSHTSPFKRSISLEHDHSAKESSHSFILTACARKAIERIMDGLSREGNPRVWTLTGPFGTGKSSFCLFLSHLLSPPSSAASISARDLLEQTDARLAATLRGTIGPRKGLVPIVVTGARESLVGAVLRSFARALEVSKAAGAKRLAKEVIDGSEDARRDPIKIVERAVTCLASADGVHGVLVIMDELGKLLEFAASNPSKSDVYFLQRLAEHAARAKIPTVVVGVLHQDFVGYAKHLSENDRQEWDKVRGRFEDIIFEQSADDMLHLLAESMRLAKAPNSSDGSSDHSKFKKLCRDAWSVGIAPPNVDVERGAPILAACYPIHPSVTLLLGPVFKRFGQNERSAFSFLSSGEPHAVSDFCARNETGAYYGVADLHQYLIAVFGDSLLSSKDGKRWAEAFNVEAQHPGLSKVESDVLRTVALLGIVGRWHGVAAMPQVLKFSLSPTWSASDVDAAIKVLLGKSAIVHRRFNDTFSLWEGSDIDIEARIVDARSRLTGDTSTTSLLKTHFTPRPVVARRHSFEKGTLRFFDVLFSTPASLEDSLATIDKLEVGKSADGHIVVLLPDSQSGTVATTSATILGMTARRDILLCVPGNAQDIDSFARELAAIQVVTKAANDLQSDATARRELSGREGEVRRGLEQVVANMLGPTMPGSLPTRWIRAGVEENVPTARLLNELLSRICDELFPQAPSIDNEIINRRDLSSSAAAAQGNLIDHMLRFASVDGLNIEGNPPEKSIYLSVLRGLKLHQERLGQWGFASSTKGIREDAQPAWRAVREFFESAEGAPRGLDELFRILRRPPFGMRDGVIPIFVCAALISNDADVAVYEGGGFITQLTDAIFEKLVKEPSRYTVRRWHVSGVRAVVFEQLGKMLGQTPISGRVEARDLLDVVKPLVRFIRDLNVFTRQTRTFAPITVAVRETIANASEPDQLLFKELPKACGMEPFAGSRKQRPEDVDAFLRILQNSLNELQKGYDTLLQSLTEELGKSLDVPIENSESRLDIIKRASRVTTVALNPEIKVFTTRLADSAADPVKWIEQVAAFLASKHPTLWHDDDRGRFGVRLRQMTEAFKGLESLVLARKPGVPESEGEESIRVAVVGSRFAQAEHVVHLKGRDAVRVQSLEDEIAKLFKPYSHNGDRRLVLAALAKITRTILLHDSNTTAQEQMT